MSTLFNTTVVVAAAALIAPASAAPQADLPARLAGHVRQIASSEHNTGSPAALEKAALYLEATLAAQGYAVRRDEYTYDGHRVRNLEVSIANIAPGKQPERIYIVGAHYDSAPGTPGANDNGSGSAAVIELARMFKGVVPAPGNELRFVLFVNEEPPYFGGEGMGSRHHARALKARGQHVEAALILETIGYYSNAKNSQRYPPGVAAFYPDQGNFIAFVGTLGSSSLVRKTVSAFRKASSFPAESLAAPSFVKGVTWSDHTSYNKEGYEAVMITDTATMRYPHYHRSTDTPDKLDYASMAKVVDGMAKVIQAMVQDR
ncbi:M28 family peptidase [Massilia pseudoviolaceinigra]|uniref:M28 family peptidase n=1 Tax=Massilia pseudoviolaceinigra TaxID=3057165 RepID=UPI0027969D10|nr:M28 family peptidase [Massilia sp. CCM 9206]MDQ1924140.1 M28 family peptidase [Massilia sp. CCM 9206]